MDLTKIGRALKKAVKLAYAVLEAAEAGGLDVKPKRRRRKRVVKSEEPKPKTRGHKRKKPGPGSATEEA